jgi:hypothetical protein
MHIKLRKYVSPLLCIAIVPLLLTACATAKKPMPDGHILGITGTGGSTLIAAKATPGKSYQLQKTKDLRSPIWQNVGPQVTANASTLALSDTNAVEASSFYRIIPLE